VDVFEQSFSGEHSSIPSSSHHLEVLPVVQGLLVWLLRGIVWFELTTNVLIDSTEWRDAIKMHECLGYRKKARTLIIDQVEKVAKTCTRDAKRIAE
jgi:hypothetical protein